MPLEVAEWIDELVLTNPVGATDPKSQGDDHLRMIKTVLQNQFLSLGQVALIDTAANINTWEGRIEDNVAAILAVDGRVDTNEGAISALDVRVTDLENAIGDKFPAGTSMLFASVPPAGWTVDSNNNIGLRVISGAPGGTAGTVNFTTVFGQSSTQGHTLDSSEIPSHDHSNAGGHTHNAIADHTHTMNMRAIGLTSAGGAVLHTPGGPDSPDLPPGVAGAHTHTTDGDHTHSSFGGGQGHNHQIDIRLQYIDVNRATKQ